jgi:hypothetical protein
MKYFKQSLTLYHVDAIGNAYQFVYGACIIIINRAPILRSLYLQSRYNELLKWTAWLPCVFIARHGSTGAANRDKVWIYWHVDNNKTKKGFMELNNGKIPFLTSAKPRHL